MERFFNRHDGRISGSIAGFDRVLFRGNISSICHIGGMDRFLSSQHVLYKDFGAFAQMISDRLKAHAQEFAKEHNRPFIYLASSKQSKEELVRDIINKENLTEGLVCLLSCVEPCQSFSIRKDAATKCIRLVVEQRKCLHFYYYFIDREFGLLHVRLQSWLPLTIQVCINGREWLARQLDKAGIGYQKVDNCFTQIDDIARAQQLMDRLSNRKWAGFLNHLARKVNPWLQTNQKLVLHPLDRLICS